MTGKINIGVIGCANIAERSIIPAIIELDSYYNLIGIASRSEEKAKAFAEKFRTKAYFNYDQLLNDKMVEAVYIPLPNALHYEWVKKALVQNIHVLVEKSLAGSPEEVNELVEIARRRNLVLIENFQFRFHSQIEELKKLICNNAIGDLRCIRSSFGFPPFKDINNIRYQKELKGGALYDAGAYPIKISQIFIGTDISVAASNLTYDDNLGIDMWGGAYLKQNNGLLFSEIAFGFDNFYQCSFELWGSKGRLYTNRIFTAHKNIKPEIIIENEVGIKRIILPEDNHFANILIHFFQLIINREGLDAEYQQNCHQARLLNEIVEKSKD